jgi:hypothetical protein
MAGSAAGAGAGNGAGVGVGSSWEAVDWGSDRGAWCARETANVAHAATTAEVPSSAQDARLRSQRRAFPAADGSSKLSAAIGPAARSSPAWKKLVSTVSK